jgi:hypothetical protein
MKTLQPSLSGMPRQSILLRKKMDTPVKPAHDVRISGKDVQ